MQCCICLEDIENPWDSGEGVMSSSLYACCGRPIHKNCGHEASKHKSTCPWCRAPLPTTREEMKCLLRVGVRANRGWACFSLGELYRGQTSVGSDRLAIALHERAIVHLNDDEWSQKLASSAKMKIAVVLYNQNRSRPMPEPVRKRIRKLLTEAAAGGHPRAKIALETMHGI